MLTASQFAWACCAAGDYPPPVPRKGPRYGPDPICCLCGGDTAGIGWHRKDGIAPTSTDMPSMQCYSSQTICQPCVATMQSAAWAQYVAAHPERGLRAAFDQKEGKAQRQWNFLYSHHLFSAPDRHECPDRARWREILANPPDPPFLAVLTTMGKKQLIFKSRIAYGRDCFPLQFEDESILIRPPEFQALLEDFMRLYLLGFSKDAIVSGAYNNKALLDCGLARWREAEQPMIEWRKRSPQLLAVCHYVAQRPADWELPTRVDYAPVAAPAAAPVATPSIPDIAPAAAPSQPSLF